MGALESKTLVYRYFQDLWNAGDVKLADTLLAPDVAVRGSLGVTVRGQDGFRGYARMVRAALPDLRIEVEELIGEGTRVAARVRYNGTHLGPLFGVAATGRAVSYPAITLFQIAEGRITEVWTVGDTLSLMTQVGVFPPLP
jgi:steroid delta-isomerase-like uncharacterized protein